jgi:hypothetical protein
MMNTKPLGRSTVRVTELSLGAAALGKLYTRVAGSAAHAAVTAACQAAVPIPADLWCELKATGLLPECVPSPGDAA